MFFNSIGMYKIYKASQQRFSVLEKPVDDCWIEMSSITDTDIERLAPYFDIPKEVLISVKDREEVPKIEEVDDFKFILVQTAVDVKDNPEEYMVKPLGILYNKNYVISLSDGQNDVIDYLKLKLKNFSKNKIIDTTKKQQLILKLMLFTSKTYLRYLKSINHKIHLSQQHMGKLFNNEDIINLMEIGKSLTYFSRAVHSNQLVIEKLAKRKYFTATEEDRELMEDVLDENKQALETIKIYEHIVTNTANTFATIVSNNLNKNVKFLTALTIILMVPTFVVSAYGMNVQLPFQNSPFAFYYIMGISAILVIASIILFYRKKLF